MMLVYGPKFLTLEGGFFCMFVGHGSDVHKVKFSCDGTWVVTVSCFGTLWVLAMIGGVIYMPCICHGFWCGSATENSMNIGGQSLMFWLFDDVSRTNLYEPLSPCASRSVFF